MSASLLPSYPGDVLRLPGEARDVLAATCEAPDRAFACLSCATRLANAYQLELHLAAGGAHVIARVCPRHGVEAWSPPPSPAPTEALHV